ncbi:MAG: dinitrogenase iron-molybdenum cofactor biosynthesis protein [bacterium]|uniref:Dinitrogenase iron-molybdenum cofactor biosynthesis protein n=1 Tax=Candidatus Infernicultor aquiphilus TaxID=1805029 RepID=A0A1J5GA41_9BACT|nr:dinitrogenase iron-molybdenum cofactor biosynthesis protein [bacterium]OIP69156.1 MAG: dinitrogenase iron-molybdenum cofactor biosynthesis protein [Candidatus Atribacteria bacterium CG2_30_33_13]PIU24920.1 MAG: dinitrogenase iron-molybdenum cofactor biosynthesis protein [Candidatus Atribacteria bacterium CG08_land_8_20_14_0_20_33_29]PIW12176.1 MAG: dinitrogenase iron-molybdenum cofactor biosynthesis protein [Candidatus Atribacteria bacterium CG17_big_fil_post_rev_8_21_14_2_50_34_11]PIX34513.
MKIAITSSGSDLKSEVDPRFGRCAYFILVETDTDEFEAVENTAAQGMGGVGIQSGQIMADREVKTVLTGSCGPNAFQTLQAAGIKVITGVSGTVQEAIDKFKSGDYKTISQADASAHSGMKK